MNREPNPNKPKFILVVGDAEVECTPHTTSAFMHQREEHRHLDHIWHVDDSGDQTIGYYIWREDLPNFNEVIAYMYQNGFDLSRKGIPADMDLECYKEQKGDRENGTQGEAKLPSTKALEAGPPKVEDLPVYGPTKERKIKNHANFIAWLIENGRL